MNNSIDMTNNPNALNPDQIRKRKTYKMFQELLEASKKSPADMLKLFDQVLNRYNCYGSERMAGYAAQSLEQLIEDEKL